MMIRGMAVMDSWGCLACLWGMAWAVGAMSTAAAAEPAGDVRVWRTLFDDGTSREVAMGLAEYGTTQDEGYELLAKLPGQSFQNPPHGHERIITVHTDTAFQAIDGIGAALTDSSAWLLSQMKVKNPALYNHTMDRLFSENHAGFSVLRKPIGSSDFTATPESYTYADVPCKDLTTFSIDHDRTYIIPVLKDILAINPSIRIIASPWSAPAWMKTNGRLHGLTREEKEAGMENRLKPEFFDVYARYFVKFIQAYDAEGINIDMVTLQNEPQFDMADYPCMRMTTDDQIALARALGPGLEAAGLTTEILVHDHNWKLHPNDLEVIGGDNKTDPFESVARIYNDPVAGHVVAGSAWHTYHGSAMDMAQVYGDLQSQFPDKRIYTTEATAWREWSNRGWPSDCIWGLRHNWLNGLANGAAAGLQWNLALDQDHGPTTRDDSLGIGIVTIDSENWAAAKFEREFYPMAHVSMAARPGSTRMGVSVQNGGGNILRLAVQRQDGSRALVVANANNDDRHFEVVVEGRYLDLFTPANSISTLVWGGEDSSGAGDSHDSPQ